MSFITGNGIVLKATATLRVGFQDILSMGMGFRIKQHWEPPSGPSLRGSSKQISFLLKVPVSWLGI